MLCIYATTENLHKGGFCSVIFSPLQGRTKATGVGFLYAVVIQVADCPAKQTINDQSQDNPFSRRHMTPGY